VVGAYAIAVRAPGRIRYEERVFVVTGVVTGRTLRIRPDLRVN
jgi:hypothetical protein